MRRAASVASLLQIKDVTRDGAVEIRRLWHGLRPDYWYPTGSEQVLYVKRRIDQILETHGVEYLGKHKRTGLHVYYCNAGDTYATTVIFHGDNLTAGCWGDLVERNLISPRGDGGF